MASVNQKSVKTLHEEAMQCVDDAILAQRQNKNAQAHDHFRQALELERAAAFLVKDRLELEPTRSVLFRSAATLALDCEDYQQAEELARIGLAGKPPNEIRTELEEVLAKAQNQLKLQR